jgi:hypothetical protein
MSKKRTSPIKEKTLRHPGQSLDEKLDKIISEDVVHYYFLGIGFILWAGYEWLRYYFKIPPNPVIPTVLAILVAPYCAYKLLKIYKETRLIIQGREGERAVGQYLESLRADGCIVFHDIIAENFNLDHVVVSKKGIYAIETKTYSKPEKGEAKILFDGEKLSIQGAGSYNQPVIQVNSASTWLQNTLKASTGKTFTVKPVILFPGWFVESTEQGKKSNTWVLNPKALPAYMKNQPEMISQEDSQMAVFHLCRYVRVKEAEKK